MIDLYQNKSRVKIGVVLVALLLAGLSLFYTQWLVRKLAKEEEKMIALYTQSIQYVAESEIEEEQMFFLEKIIASNESVPVILMQKGKIIDSKNILPPDILPNSERGKGILQAELETMKQHHAPIVVKVKNATTSYVYYRDSDLLIQLRYYPTILLLVVAVFAYLAYLAFSSSRRAEQNRIWVGLAKETAHQLGTPISSLMAWVEYLKTEPHLEEVRIELQKDIKRLEMITSRFSSIGSEPTLKEEDIYFIILGITNYLQRRISTKVKMYITNDLPRGTIIQLNRHLFEWVIENLCKNAVDAMAGVGELHIHLQEAPEGHVIIDISDTGKGISKKQLTKVFNPGFTTKKRGWGLGLTLAKRIVEEYHRGKIFVKQSEIDKGTTFRIILRGFMD
jgi:two-component system, sporulation sensor kinase E